VVSGLKMSYAMFPDARDQIDEVVGGLVQTNAYFAELWAQDDPLVKPTIEKQYKHPGVGQVNVLQILTDIVEAPGLTRIEIIPADEETRYKFERI
jgi:hypothetical protein